MSKRCSRRLRKKLRLAEFQELGFSVDVSFKRQLTPVESDAFIDALLSELIEPRCLAYGGWTHGGFVVHERRGSVNEGDRQAVLAWLEAREEVRTVKAGALMDAWYGKEEAENAL